MSWANRETWPILIAGEWVETRNLAEIRSPYSGELVARVSGAGRTETIATIDAAARAMSTELPAHRRAEILEKVARSLERSSSDVAHILCQEAAKPITTARAEVERAATTFYLSAQEARRASGEVVPMGGWATGYGKVAFTLGKPLGVIGAITPFNFPLNLAAHKLGPALAAGCAVVLKPAPQTPLTALILGELLMEAGLPPGWLSIVTGQADEIASVLIDDPRVAAISFTGSSEVGWALRDRAPRKRVLLELGGSAPVIVTPHANLERAAMRTVWGAFSYAGQSCISVQRVYVQKAAMETFLRELLPRVESLRSGDPMDPEVDVGPVINTRAKERIVDLIEHARNAGGRVVAGGATTEDGIVLPTVLTSDADLLADDEIFGPVCVVSPYSNLEDAIGRANSTRYGLQAGVFTNRLDEARLAASTLEFGSVIINDVPTFRADHMPYGGTKDSGNTKEGPAYAMREFTEETLIVVAF